MEKIRFNNIPIIYEGVTDFINRHVIVIKFNDNNSPNLAEIDGNGFEILNENNDFVQADYRDFTTIYRIYPDNPCKIELSNDGSVYIEPEKFPDPEPYIPTLGDIKSQKINELSHVCSQLITAGVSIDIDGTMEQFSYKDEDQVNIKEIFDLAVQTNVPMYYHSDGNSCKLYTVDQIIALYIAITTNKMHHQTYFNQLKLYILDQNNEEEVKDINYGDELTGEYLATYNDAMMQAQELLNVLLKRGILETETDAK